MKFSPLWGDWHIKNQVGKGSFGTVYRAEKVEYGNTYISAVKHIEIPADGITDAEIISEGLATDDASVSAYYDNIRDKLLSEIQTCYQLKGNTNIVSYEDHLVIKKENGRGYDVFIRMEFLQSLPDYLRYNTVTADCVINLGINLCDALSLLNKRNIIHRDIKPANIFINKDGVFKIGDFSESKVLSKTTGGMSVKGTYTYMPPEIFHGGVVNRTADIYSLGMVMYRLLNDNRPPFSPPLPMPINADIVQESNNRRFKCEPIPKPTNCSNMNLVNVILKACEANPQNRWQTPEAFKQALMQAKNNPNAPIGHFDDTISQANMLKGQSDNNYNKQPNCGGANSSGFVNVKEYNGSSRSQGYSNSQWQQSVPQKSSNKALIAVITVLIVILVAVIVAGAAIVIPKLNFGNDDSSAGSSSNGSSDVESGVAPTEGSTYPKAGSTGTVSSGSELSDSEILLGSYENKLYTEAEATLESQGLVVNIDYQHSDSVQKNYIISQSISAGTSVEKGRMITLIVSSGPSACPYDYSQKVVVQSTGTNSNATLKFYNWGDGEWEEMFSCSAKVGANGVGSDYGEGKKITPSGIFKLGIILSSHSIITNMPSRVVSETTCVVDDVNSPLYNTIQDTSDLRDDTSRDLIGKKLCDGTVNALIYIEHNGDGITSSGVVAGKGSVITICGCNSTPGATYGCIDITAENMNTLIGLLDSVKNPQIEIN